MELDAVGKAIVQYHLVPLVHQANLGLEVTMHRVDAHGHLATTAHPQAFDQRNKIISYVRAFPQVL